MEFLPYTREQLKEHCKSLSNKEKVDTYKWILSKAKNVIESKKDVAQLKRLSDVAVAIEETTDEELLRPFDDNHPLKKANIALVPDDKENLKGANYLFSIGSSSKLYDLKEDKKEALYQAVKSDNVGLVKRLLAILLYNDQKDTYQLDLQQTNEFLSKFYDWCSFDSKNTI